MAAGCSSFCSRFYPLGFTEEAKAVTLLSIPLVLTQLTLFIMGPVALIFCGHLGTEQLDAVALANSMINVFGLSVAVGLSSACDTLFSQFYGSENKSHMGVILQRSLLVITMATLPCYAIHLNAERFLIAIGQDAKVASLTGEYLLYVMPGILAFFIFISVSKYIQNQNIVIPNLIIGAIANGINALLHYILLYVVKLGIIGSAISQSFSYTTMLVLTVIYILVSGKHKTTWHGWSRGCLEEWGLFFRLAFFGLLMICIEWWAFEIGMFLSGNLGKVQLGANSVVFQLEVFAYMIPLGLGIAGNIRVGQYLGAGSADGARTACRVALTLVVGVCFVIGAFLAIFRQYLPRIFSNDQEVIDLAAKVLPILGAYLIFDGICATSGGILRGAGRQATGAIVVFFGYLMAMSGAIPTMFLTDLGILGLWIFLALALLADSIVYSVLLYRLDWDKEVKLAQQRTGCDENAVNGTDNHHDSETSPLLGSGHSRTGTPPAKTIVARRFSTSYNEYTHPPVAANGVIQDGVTPDGVTPETDSVTMELIDMHDSTPLGRLLCYRGLTFLIVAAIFIAGLLCRLLLPPIPISPANGNVTLTTDILTTEAMFFYNVTSHLSSADFT